MVSRGELEPNGHVRSGEKRRRRITRPESQLQPVTSAIEYPLEIQLIDEMDPMRTRDLLLAIKKVGRQNQEFASIIRPGPDEEDVAETRKEIIEKAHDSLGEITDLAQNGFVPQTYREKAAKALAVYRTFMLDKEELKEQLSSRETKLSPMQAAVLAVVTADVYLNQEGEEIFPANQDFFRLMGRLGNYLPPTGSDQMDEVSFRDAKRNLVGKLSTQMQDFSNLEEEDPSRLLLAWINKNIQEKNRFYLEALAAKYGDKRGIVSLRREFRTALQGSVDKFYSLHPEIIQKEKEELAKQPNVAKTNNASPMEVFTQTSPTRRYDKKVPATIANDVSGLENAEEALRFIIENYSNIDVIGKLDEAHAVASGAGIPLGYSRTADILFLYNLEYSRDNDGRSLTLEQRKAVGKMISRLKKRPKS